MLARTLRIAAGRMLPGAAMMAAGAVVCADLSLAAAEGMLSPRRLAIYYGIPSLVNGARGDVTRAAAAFGEYDVLVFGDGLELPDVVPGRTPPGPGAVEQRTTKQIIRLLSGVGRRPIVFGYIDLGRSQNLSDREIDRRVALWRESGAGGIFFDEAGYDFGVSRLRQNAAIDAAHGAGMRVFMNAFNPDDVFLPSDGAKHHLRSGDAYLLESFVIRNGTPDDAHAWGDRAAHAVELARPHGVRVYATTTAAAGAPASDGLVAYAWWAAIAHGLDGFGWGEPSFGASDSRLPWRARPEQAAASIGDRLVGSIMLSNAVYVRHTNRGTIEIDTRRHHGRFVRSEPVR